MEALERPALYLLRHGETEWNLARRFQGRSDSPLTDRGLAQAECYASALEGRRGIRSFRLISSPLGRAASTARIVADRLALPLSFDERLVELSLVPDSEPGLGSPT